MQNKSKVSFWTGVITSVGVLILTGYLNRKYTPSVPLTVTNYLAVICVGFSWVICYLETRGDSLAAQLEEEKSDEKTARRYSRMLWEKRNTKDFITFLSSNQQKDLLFDLIKLEGDTAPVANLLNDTKFSKETLTKATKLAITNLRTGCFELLIGAKFIGANDEHFLHDLIFKAREISGAQLECFLVMLKTLISAGADLSALGESNKTPFKLCKSQSYPYISVEDVDKIAELLTPKPAQT
jgi:hypothetical protein